MPYLNAGASRLYHEVHGEGPPVVLLHGVGGNHASWFHQFSALRERFTLIAIDARGFGNSEDVEGLGRSAFMSDLALVLDALELPRVSIVAQSMGGGTAASFTCQYPRRVRSLVLADTLVGIELPAAIQPFMKEVSEKGMALTQLQRVLGPTFSAREPAMSALYLALASFNSVNVRTLTGTQPKSTTAQLSASGVPILFIAGEEDVLFPPRAIQAVQAEVAGSAYAEIAQAGHSAYFENPAPFNELIADWILGHGD
ncbi:MAG: alpha/beta hydrolase [Rhizobacter sp.]|nr:alpha/beta hydrolase [Rhizobacter sp.]